MNPVYCSGGCGAKHPVGDVVQWRCSECRAKARRDGAATSSDRDHALAWMAQPCKGDPADSDGIATARIEGACPACAASLAALLAEVRETTLVAAIAIARSVGADNDVVDEASEIIRCLRELRGNER